MKYIALLLFISFAISNLTLGQDKKTIAVTPFTSAGTKDAIAYANSVSEVVLNAIVKTNRFTVVDRTHFDAIFSEENLQKGESFIEGFVVDQGKKIGAQYIITGNLVSATAEAVYETIADKQYTDKKNEKTYLSTKQVLKGYKAQVSYTIKVLDVETGRVMGSGMIDNRSGGMWIFESTYGSKAEAISNAIKNSFTRVLKFINQQFPVSMKILEIADKSKTKAKQLVVTAGKAKGLLPGQDLRVFEVYSVSVDGKTLERNKPIGLVKVVSVDDDNFSTCKVKDGGKVILAAYNAGKNIVVKSGSSR